MTTSVAEIRPTEATMIWMKSVTVTAQRPPKAVNPTKNAVTMMALVVISPIPRDASTLPAELTWLARIPTRARSERTVVARRRKELLYRRSTISVTVYTRIPSILFSTRHTARMPRAPATGLQYELTPTL